MLEISNFRHIGITKTALKTPKQMLNIASIK